MLLSSWNTCKKISYYIHIFKRELRVLALLGIEKLLLLLLLRGGNLSPGSTNFRVLRLVKFVYEFCK